MKIKKYEWEDLFVKTAWISEVWDKGNRRAKRYNKIAMKNLDARWCVRAKHQVTDIELRKRYFGARYDGATPPKIVPAVKRHFDKEFDSTYPKGVPDTIDSITQTQYSCGCFARKIAFEGVSMDKPFFVSKIR